LAVKLLLTAITTAVVSEWFAALARACAAVAMLTLVRVEGGRIGREVAHDRIGRGVRERLRRGVRCIQRTQRRGCCTGIAAVSCTVAVSAGAKPGVAGRAGAEAGTDVDGTATRIGPDAVAGTAGTNTRSVSATGGRTVATPGPVTTAATVTAAGTSSTSALASTGSAPTATPVGPDGVGLEVQRSRVDPEGSEADCQSQGSGRQ